MELKEKFEKKWQELPIQVSSHKTARNTIWRLFEENTVPKSRYERLEQTIEDVEEASKALAQQVIDLQKENDKLKNDMMLIIAPKEVGGGIESYLQPQLAEERKRVIEECIGICIKELYDASIDKNIRYPSVDLILDEIQQLGKG